MSSRFPFPGIPAGWYVVAVSDELRPGALLARRYFDRELVIYRTGSGSVRVADAFCPHLGAHLGKVGHVEGDQLRCGFHGFRYDEAGVCVATAYDGPPPAEARLPHARVEEQNGLVLAWYDPLGRDPGWRVPVLDERGWNRIRWSRYGIDTTPQETTENSVDLGHFTQLHGFVEGWITRPIQTDGAHLSIAYCAVKPVGPARLEVHYDVKVSGLGYSQVDVRIPALRLDIRVFVLPVPIGPERVDLVLGASTTTNLGPASRLVRRIAHSVLCGEVERDLDVWNHKIYVHPPALAKGDGPIGLYRRWAGQFYAAD